MSDLGLPRSERLRSLKAIRRMFGEGKSGFVYPFRYAYYKEPMGGEGEAVEVMFSVPKKFHKRANKRNLLKRRTREAFRQSELRKKLRTLATEKAVSVDLAFIYSTKEIHSHKTITHAVQRILEQVCENV
jgi:ribonuclease P protein component